MRTREEQIIGCAQYLISMRASGKCTEYDLVSCIVEEAEQRVRAELSAQIEQQEETIKALQDDLSAALAQIEELTL